MSAWSNLMRQAAVLCGLLTVALAVVLMAIKYQVQAYEEELAHLNDRIVQEKQTIQILKAEFSYRTEPDRLRGLATQYLGLVPIEPAQLATFAGLDDPRFDQHVDPVVGTAPVKQRSLAMGARR
ncbi:MAG: hypothetical protein KF815_14570 [Rhodospirillales bacterium]|uniref:Cell division protein FtsL n=1 Tax=metagenome TaxID=256318 RepID=A0A380TE05_9ZZZZ|nr:hypothetical protein [Rhodospirillales bacterium]SUS06705.1 hypothetical protein DF3PB_3140003 [uncultured Defluviicoccus sp.]HRW60942.1 hypothetical protein [Defluviicoccus sp.]